MRLALSLLAATAVAVAAFGGCGSDVATDAATSGEGGAPGPTASSSGVSSSSRSSSASTASSASSAAAGGGGTGGSGLESCGGGGAAPSGAWPSWAPPPDAPTAGQYTVDAANGTVTDVTGLVWARDVPASRHTWDDAQAACSCLTLGGFDDWRLPNAVELLSIVDLGSVTPAISTSAFPATPSEWTWTATPYVFAGGFAPWAVNFQSGMTTSYGEGDMGTHFTTPVRCVRGPLGNAAPPAYVVSGGTVLDPVSNLTWEEAPSAQQVTLDGARSRCAALTLGGATWRLPGAKELASLVDRTAPNGSLAASPIHVAQGQRAVFWSSSPDVGTMGLNQWTVDLDEGSVLVSAAIGGVQNSVLCVR